MASKTESNQVVYLPIHVSKEDAENLMKMGIIIEVENINSAALVMTKLSDILLLFNQRINILEGTCTKLLGDLN